MEIVRSTASPYRLVPLDLGCVPSNNRRTHHQKFVNKNKKVVRPGAEPVTTACFGDHDYIAGPSSYTQSHIAPQSETIELPEQILAESDGDEIISMPIISKPTIAKITPPSPIERPEPIKMPITTVNPHFHPPPKPPPFKPIFRTNLAAISKPINDKIASRTRNSEVGTNKVEIGTLTGDGPSNTVVGKLPASSPQVSVDTGSSTSNASLESEESSSSVVVKVPQPTVEEPDTSHSSDTNNTSNPSEGQENESETNKSTEESSSTDAAAFFRQLLGNDFKKMTKVAIPSEDQKIVHDLLNKRARNGRASIEPKTIAESSQTLLRSRLRNKTSNVEVDEDQSNRRLRKRISQSTENEEVDVEAPAEKRATRSNLRASLAPELKEQDNQIKQSKERELRLQRRSAIEPELVSKEEPKRSKPPKVENTKGDVRKGKKNGEASVEKKGIEIDEREIRRIQRQTRSELLKVEEIMRESLKSEELQTETRKSRRISTRVRTFTPEISPERKRTKTEEKTDGEEPPQSDQVEQAVNPTDVSKTENDFDRNLPTPSEVDVLNDCEDDTLPSCSFSSCAAPDSTENANSSLPKRRKKKKKKKTVGEKDLNAVRKLFYQLIENEPDMDFRVGDLISIDFSAINTEARHRFLPGREFTFDNLRLIIASITVQTINFEMHEPKVKNENEQIPSTEPNALTNAKTSFVPKLNNTYGNEQEQNEEVEMFEMNTAEGTPRDYTPPSQRMDRQIHELHRMASALSVVKGWADGGHAQDVVDCVAEARAQLFFMLYECIAV